jgi:pimeloyl-ACP methyl ester carboxylesterase
MSSSELTLLQIRKGTNMHVNFMGTALLYLTIQACNTPQKNSAPMNLEGSEKPRFPLSCSSADHHIMEVPKDWMNPNGTKKPFLYYHALPSEPGQPTIIYLDGGPGVSSIQNEIYYHFFPSKTGLMLFDARSIGCNRSYDNRDFDESEMASSVASEDLISTIKAAKLDNYYIYGFSYGTVLATITAAKIRERIDLPQPKGLILAGVFGRAVPSYQELMAPTVALWNQYRSLPDATAAANVQMLSSPVLPHELSSGQWGDFITRVGFSGTHSLQRAAIIPAPASPILWVCLHSFLESSALRHGSDSRSRILLRIVLKNRKPAARSDLR